MGSHPRHRLSIVFPMILPRKFDRFIHLGVDSRLLRGLAISRGDDDAIGQATDGGFGTGGGGGLGAISDSRGGVE